MIWRLHFLDSVDYLEYEGLAMTKVNEVDETAWGQLSSLVYQIETALSGAGYDPKYCKDYETGRTYSFSALRCPIKSSSIEKRIVWVGVYYDRPR